jgi:hypothetical protein
VTPLPQQRLLQLHPDGAAPVVKQNKGIHMAFKQRLAAIAAIGALAALSASAFAAPVKNDIYSGGQRATDTRDVYTDGARIGNRDVYTDGARVTGQRDVYSDGARVTDRRDSFTDGA